MNCSFNRISCKAFAFVGIVLFASSVPILLSAAIGKLAVTIKKIASANITNNNNEMQALRMAMLVSQKIDDFLITNKSSSTQALGYTFINNSDPSIQVGTLFEAISPTTNPVDILSKDDTCEITNIRSVATGTNPICSSSKMKRHDSIARPSGAAGSIATSPAFGGYIVKVFDSSIDLSDPTRATAIYDLTISAYVCDSGNAANAFCNANSNMGVKTIHIKKKRSCPDTSSAAYGSVAYGQQLIVANDPGKDLFNLNCSCPANGVIQKTGSCTCAPGKKLSGSTCVNCTAGTDWSPGGLVATCTPCSGCSGAACSVTSGCNTCSPGKKIGSGGACVDCVSGSTWSPGGTSTTCSSCSGCSSGNCNVSLGCTSCPAGNKLINGNCVPCGAGEWSINGNSSSTCTSCSGCSAGSCSATLGCTSCPAGNRLSSGSCVSCGGSQWSSGGTSTTCSSCAGCASSCGGGTACSSCIAGNKLINGNCVACGSGEWSAGGSANSCNSCSTCSSCSVVSGCTACPAGNKLISGNCVACNSGEWSAGGSANSCNSCSTCSSCSVVSGCTTCPAGNKLISGNCVACGSGEWSAGGSANSCNSCSTCSSCSVVSGCTACPAGTQLSSGNCVGCNAGQWSPGGASACSSCLGSQVTSCSITTGGATACSPNYQLSGPSGASGTTCILQCPDHSTSCNPTTGGANGCVTYFGLSGTSGAAGTTCVACPSNCTSCALVSQITSDSSLLYYYGSYLVCQTCDSGYTLIKGGANIGYLANAVMNNVSGCLPSCPSGRYWDGSLNNCIYCTVTFHNFPWKDYGC